MVHIYDIAPAELWAAEFQNKHINRQVHPTLDLAIFDYSQVCQFDRAWNAATLASRGLIVDGSTQEIVSRPLGKFFNHGEPDVPQDALTGPIVVTDKADGSMGVSYVNPETGRLNISTRGSFSSEQALHATARYQELYDGKWEPLAGETYIWEIIYPTNRIVVNYGDLDDLILIARVNTATGRSVPASQVEEWTWLKVEQFEYSSLTEALAAPGRENKEGVVVHFLDSDVRVKVKQDDYIQLHRVITGASSRRIWELLVADGDFTSWIVGLPDEFVEYVETTRDRLIAEHTEVRSTVEETYNRILSELPEGYTQKDYAAAVQKEDKRITGLLFSRHSGGHFEAKSEKKISDIIWKMIQPEFEKPFWNLNGKTAD